MFRVRYTVGFLAHHLFNRRGHPESTSGFYTNKHQVLPIPFSSVVARTSNGSNCRSGFPVRRWSPSAVDDDSRCELRISSSVCAGVSVRREGVKGLQATCIFHVFQRQGRPPPCRTQVSGGEGRPEGLFSSTQGLHRAGENPKLLRQRTGLDLTGLHLPIR